MVFDLEALRKDSGNAAAAKIAFLVDMAKAEAMDDLGRPAEARELAERYL